MVSLLSCHSKFIANLTKGTKTHTEVELMAIEGSKSVEAHLMPKEQEEKLTQDILNMIMYKAKKLSLGLCCCKKLC